MKLSKMIIALVAMLLGVAHSVSAQVAVVDGENYASLQEAIAAADGKVVKLLSDIEVDTKTFTIADGQNVVLDMNNMSITAIDNASGNYELFYIYGELTVKGNGTINLASTIDRNWNNMSAIFHNRGGVLTIENGTFINNGGTDMAFTIDNSGNYFGDATTNIHGGLIKSSYIAIRNRMEQNNHGYSGKTYLNITGGTIEGVRRTIWGQAASVNESAPAQGEINISGGEVRGLIETPQANGAESMTTVTGGSVENFIGEVGELKVTGEAEVTGEVTLYSVSAEGTKTEVEYVVNSDGVYVENNPVARVGGEDFSDIYAAVEAAVETGNDVTILKDLELTKSILIFGNVNFTIQGSTKTIRFVDTDDNFGFIIKDLATVTFAEGLNIVGAGNSVCPLYIQSAFVNTKANISTTAENTLPPIMTNADNLAVLNVQGGNIVSGNPAVAGIYWPSTGTLTVTGGKIEGANAVYFKSGELRITGGKFLGTGAQQAYGYVADGYKATGAALVVENVGGGTAYDKIKSVYINGGTFLSDHSDAVQSYTAGMAGIASLKGFIYGGTFSSDVSALLAENLIVKDNGDGTYSVIPNPSLTYVAKIGSYQYTTLAAAVKGAKTGETIELLEDVTLTELVKLNVKDLVLDLKGKTVTANCKKAFEVSAKTTIKNGTIIAEQRCVDTRTNINLTLEQLSLEATSLKHGNPQPITIGGYENGTTVTMSKVNINAALGYGIISFVETDVVATDCQIKGYSAIYAKENNASNSEFTLNNCTLEAVSPAFAGDANAFSLIAIRANNVTVNVNGGLLRGAGTVSVMSFHGYNDALDIIFVKDCKVIFDSNATLEGDLIIEAKTNFEDNTIILPAAYSEDLKAEGFYLKDNGNGTVTPTKVVDFEDVDFAYTNTTDIEGLTISYKRTFKNHSVWNAMFLPFEVPASMLLDNYQIAEWTGMLYETDGDGTVTATGIELTKIKNEAAILQANHPYLIYPKTEAAKELEIALDDATLYGADENNAVVLSNEVMTCKIVGNYRTLQKEELVDEYGERGWVMSASGKLAHSSSAMKPFRFLLTRTWNPGVNVNLSSSAMRVVFRNSDDVTAIENAALNAGKENVVYDLQGRRVMKPTTRGIYIVNGKKVFVK